MPARIPVRWPDSKHPKSTARSSPSRDYFSGYARSHPGRKTKSVEGERRKKISIYIRLY